MVWAFAYFYIFNAKIDVNGDNCRYYTYATALATGQGYTDISAPTPHPTNAFPPGYPLLMMPLRFFTDSVVAQKVLNGLFLLGGALLLFFLMIKRKLPDSLALVGACAAILSDRVLHFSTMMMSEMSCFFVSAAAIYLLTLMKEEKPFYKDWAFYGMLVMVLLCYHIRTQGVALFAAVVLFFLCSKKWKEAAGTVAGFVVGCLPWVLRNKALGLGQSRYFESIAQVNPWRPEDGSLDLGGIVGRFFDTLAMLVSKALPNSVIPYFKVDYTPEVSAGFLLWVAAIVLVALIVRGFWSFGKYRWVLIGYTVFTFGLISIFSTPSENRYLTSIIPFLNMGLLVGLYEVVVWALRRMGSKLAFSPWILALLLLTSVGNIKELHAMNRMPFPPAYQNFFRMGAVLKEHVSPETVVASRKGELLYMFSGTRVTGYAFSQDDRAVIQKMLDDGVEYVILDQLGYSSTYRYLYPAIQKNDDLFFLEGKCSRQMCFQEGKRLTTFGEDNQTILGIFFVPTEFRTISSVKQIDETLEFAEILNLDRLNFGQEVFECRNVVGKRLARCLVVLSTQLFESVFDCRNTGLRA